MRLPGQRILRAIAGAGLLALFPLRTIAREIWLAPLQPAFAPHELARFDLSAGAAFPRAERAVPSDRIERAGIQAQGQMLRFSGRSRRKTSLRLAAPIDRACVASAWVVLQSERVERGPAELREYLARIGETEGAWKAIADSPPASWKQLERQSARTFVRVGTPGPADRSWSDPVGLPLEIVPERDPTRLVAGDVLPVRVFLDRGAVEGIAVFAIPAAGGERRMGRTGPDGRTRIPLTEPGAWLLEAARLERADGPDADGRSEATSLYLTVGEPPAAPSRAAAAPADGPGPATLVPDQPFTGQPPAVKKPYEEILRRKEAGESDEALIAGIRAGNTVYSLTTADIQKLRAAGVSRDVIEAMLRSGRGATPRPR